MIFFDASTRGDTTEKQRRWLLPQAAEVGARDRIFAALESSLSQTESFVADALRSTRFLREKRKFVSRDEDIYVVSYPRSGTTWVQFLVYLLVSERDLEFDHLSQVSPWWERSMALGTRRASDFLSISNPRIFKSHLPRRWLPQNGRFLYIVRDGLDVALSYHHLYQSHLGFQDDFAAFFDRFMQGRLQYGSWFKHVEGWRAFEEDQKVHFVEYEGLRRDLEGSVRSIASFLRLPLSELALSQVLEMGSFQFMKAHEPKFDPMTETMIDQGFVAGRFIRSGQSGEGAQAVTDTMKAAFERAKSKRRLLSTMEARLPDFLH